MPPPPRPWENSSSSGAASSGALVPVDNSGLVTSPLTTTTGAAAVTSSSDGVGTTVGSSSAPPLPTSATASAQRLGLGAAGSSLPYSRYGGMGMGLGGYGGMGMGGMGSMYGGMGGMGMGLGGYGMGGMGMGMMGGYGMGMGMGMYGSEAEQRGQMLLMVFGRIVEMFHQLTAVMQMSVASTMQFMGSFVGLSQQYDQLHSNTAGEEVEQEEIHSERREGEYGMNEGDTLSSSGGRKIGAEREMALGGGGQVTKRPSPPKSLSAFLFKLIKEIALASAALFLAYRIQRYFSKPKAAEMELEAAYNMALNPPPPPPQVPPHHPHHPSSMGMGLGGGMGLRGAHSAFAYSPGAIGYGANYY